MHIRIRYCAGLGGNGGENMKEITYKPIGIIRSPFKDIKGMPIQPTAAKGIPGRVEIEPAFVDGLKDIEGFSHIILLYHFHLSEKYSLRVKPFLDSQMHGVFATRAPARPNAIGISVVRLIKVEDNTLHIEDVDIVDATPLLDIKPYVPEFEPREVEKLGWLSNKVNQLKDKKSDRRFQ